jgi:hypothetical protein
MRSERFLAATGAIYVVLTVVGNGLATADGDPQDGPAILAHLRGGRSATETAGVLMEVLGTAALLVFLGYLYRVLRRNEDGQGWAAPVAFGAGLVTVAVKLASATSALAARAHPNQLTPDLARVLNDLGGAGFVISGYLFGIFVAAAAGAAMSSRALPRWLAISGVVVGALAVAAGAAGVLDPLGYVPIPFLLCLAWVLSCSIVLTVRGRREAGTTHDRTADAVPAGVPTTA